MNLLSSDKFQRSINEGDLLLAVGVTFGHLGQSAIIDEIFNLQDGTPPKVDLHLEKQNGFFILNNKKVIKQSCLVETCPLYYTEQGSVQCFTNAILPPLKLGFIVFLFFFFKLKKD